MYHFIINPHSKTGRAKSIWLELKKKLDDQSVEYKSYMSKKQGDAAKICSKICSYKGTKKIIIIGGDGTANEVLNGIQDPSNVILGYIPLGSGNDLARGLKLPKNPLMVLDLILHPVLFRYVDHGITTVNDTKQNHRFAVSSGIGYDAAICQEAQTSPLKKLLNKLHLGKLTYILIAIKQVFTHQQTEADIIIDQHKHIHTKRLIFMASLIHKYEGGGLLMAPNAKDYD